MDKSESGISFLGLLFLLFLGLKLGHVIDWSWWYIFMPLYLPFLIGLVVVLFMIIFAKYSVKRLFRNW